MMTKRMNLTMGTVGNTGTPSQEDMDLFRRVMRVMNVFQNKTSSGAKLFLPSEPTYIRPTFNFDLKINQPVMVGEIFGGPKDEDEDELSDDSDEYMSDDVDEEDNDEQSTSSEVDDGEDQANTSGECDEEEEDDDDDFFDEDDFSDSESNEGRNGSHSSHMVTCPDGLPPSSDLTYVGSFQPLYTPITTISPVILGKSDTGGNNGDGDGDGDGDGTSLCCWEHGCNGRKFTTRSNLRRHLREKSRARPICRCPRCGAVFSRTTARNTHVARGSCNRIRRYSNGRVRPNLRITDK
ncbi:hypothetical protein BKA67DRAFT_576818 [Truncatella angustata]|uniref:C2H2-type domain-containing protein n=1 Tax=Truncatella angustata TaxID=152316 RepID=A0A9P8UFU2_9PEZI|nr:uncharacterized protein BKA67DRAFT_576818 [Truncatella angustata]KAH6649114.1 hypothetical protein BKA67DRAFT_576818 [Truncatella angustata]